jgi:hypothetical protein
VGGGDRIAVGVAVSTTLQEQVWLQAVKQCEARVSQTEREHSAATAQLRIAVEELRRARALRVAPEDVPTLVEPIDRHTRVIDMRNGRTL